MSNTNKPGFRLKEWGSESAKKGLSSFMQDLRAEEIMRDKFGMSKRQGIQEAKSWWQSRARDLIRNDRSRKRDGFSGDEEVMTSGIISGAPWEFLTDEEKATVTVVYLYEVFLPQQLENFHKELESPDSE